MMLKASVVPKFQASKTLKDMLNCVLSGSSHRRGAHILRARSNPTLEPVLYTRSGRALERQRGLGRLAQR